MTTPGSCHFCMLQYKYGGLLNIRGGSPKSARRAGKNSVCTSAAINPPHWHTDMGTDEETFFGPFHEAMKAGAFDFILSVAADVKTPEWQDAGRLGIRHWLQRKSPSLLEAVQFSDPFQTVLMIHLENLVEGLISNLPDALRRMRSEEDEQRQLSQTHEQDLDLERFLLIIAYAYEGRPDAASAFWTDPDSNLAGFLHWASRRASTPLVSAFCEMLQSLSDDDACATAAHNFLLDESQPASGKMRKSLSLTWTQIFKELHFFTVKLRERPSTSQSHIYRSGKPPPEQAEAEPESAMMLECYLRLITKLSSQSEDVRTFLLTDDFNLVQGLFLLASTSIPARLKSYTFYALRALMSRKTEEEGTIMWAVLDSWATGQHNPPPIQGRQPVGPTNQTPAAQMRRQLLELSRGFEEPNAVVQFLNSLISPVNEASALSDALPFPEDLGSQVRMPGIDPYVDYVLGFVFADNSGTLQEVTQMRMLRLSCLEFALLCLETFNEDLIVLGNETNIPVDSIIATTDLATYIRLHPFARVMEWMLNERVMAALFEAVNQRHPDDVAQLASASPDSPVILSTLRAVEVVSKVLDMQDTYADLVRPLLRSQSIKREPVATSYTSFTDGMMNHLPLIVNLGRYCGMGHPALTLACLKLLEKVSSSARIASAWNPGHFGQTHRNKAIVALESNGDADSISGSFIAELIAPLDLARGADSPNYMIKLYILDFLFACLQATPNQPSIAHLFLGFQCGIDSVSVETEGDFESRTSMFHNLLRVLLETPFGDGGTGMWRWTIELKFKIMRILRILWTSPLTSSIVLPELRDNEFLFHLLLGEIPIQPSLAWDGQLMAGPEFLTSESSMTFISFLALRAITLEYASIELCSVSQHRLPHFKRRLIDALNGQLKGDDGEHIPVASIFDLFDFLPPDGQSWEVPPPQFQYYRDLDLRPCLSEDADGNPIYHINRVKDILILKRSEFASQGQIAAEKDIELLDREESLLVEFMEFSNRQKQLSSFRLKVLRYWSNVLLVMFESNEFKGSAHTSFLLQALQAVLPSLEMYASDSPDEAYELAKLAKILLFKVDFSATKSEHRDVRKAGDLVSDKLFQLFQICLAAIGKWAGSSELRAVYYGICYRYLAGIVQKDEDFLPSRHKAVKSIHVHGERLLNVVCDDAYGGDTACQTAALILLNVLVELGSVADDAYVVENLNRLNFIGILVDSLRSMLAEWLEIAQTSEFPNQPGAGTGQHPSAPTPSPTPLRPQHHQPSRDSQANSPDVGNTEAELLWNARLALVLSICQTRDGAAYALQANLFPAIEQSGLFAADPELLEEGPRSATATAALERHYALLVRVARVICAAVLTRGPQSSVAQGPARRFLSEHRMLIVQTLKRSAGIGGNAGAGGGAGAGAGAGGGNKNSNKEAARLLEDAVEELAESFIVLISATGFLEFEEEMAAPKVNGPQAGGLPTLFH
jgi:nuclear pore complex protein Nup205